jgi:lycopene beta-cyclase
MGSSNYLVLVLVWIAPVLIVQMALGFDLFLRWWRPWILGVVIAGVFFTAVDAVSLSGGAWQINRTQLTGWQVPIFNLSLEQALYNVLISAALVQGVILLRERQTVIQRLRTLGQTMRALMRRQPPER